MRKVLWSGSLKHQGASLTAPHSHPPPPPTPGLNAQIRGGLLLQPSLPIYQWEAAQMVESAA